MSTARAGATVSQPAGRYGGVMRTSRVSSRPPFLLPGITANHEPAWKPHDGLRSAEDDRLPVDELVAHGRERGAHSWSATSCLSPRFSSSSAFSRRNWGRNSAPCTRTRASTRARTRHSARITAHTRKAMLEDAASEELVGDFGHDGTPRAVRGREALVVPEFHAGTPTGAPVTSDLASSPPAALTHPAIRSPSTSYIPTDRSRHLLPASESAIPPPG